MKIYLVKEGLCKFDKHGVSTIENLDFKSSTAWDSGRLFCEHLHAQFEKITGSSIKTQKLSIHLNMVIDCRLRLRLKDPSQILESLNNKIILDEIIQVGVLLRSFDRFRVIHHSITNDMLIKNGQRYVCEDATVIGSSHINRKLVDREEFEAYVSIFLFTSKTNWQPPQINQRNSSICKKILDDEIGSDAVIVAGNGIPVKCHKSFLIAHSLVFDTMFKTDMEEKATGNVEMPDMSEEGVRAFLAYLYYSNDTEPNNKSTIAFELLNAGHKYDIPTLESAMASILISKPVAWFDVDVAIRLFIFSRGLTSAHEDKLKMKAIKVMKENFTSLKQSSMYQDLFKINSQAAMELCEHLFNSSLKQ